MFVMKKIICFVVLIALMLPVLCACGEKHTSAADAYLDIAQGYVDEGKYAAAISTLEKGYKATGDSRIAVMMAELAMHKEENEESVPENVATEPAEKETQPKEIVTTTPATQPGTSAGTTVPGTQGSTTAPAPAPLPAASVPVPTLSGNNDNDNSGTWIIVAILIVVILACGGVVVYFLVIKRKHENDEQ